MIMNRGMRAGFTSAAVAGALVMAVMCARVLAHEITVKGTVAAIEKTRIQVKTGEEKKGVAPGWYPIDAKTKILRGKDPVPQDRAKIAVGEKVVVIVDHETNGTMKALEIRLAAQ
jgi:hypothetical protein